VKFTPAQWATIEAETTCPAAKVFYALSHVAYLVKTPADCIRMMSLISDRDRTHLEDSISFPGVRRAPS
jgi:hypothetical protein